MAIFRRRLRIPNYLKKEHNIEERYYNAVPYNSFYVSGGGKEYKDYLESPENRCIAGLTIEKD